MSIAMKRAAVALLAVTTLATAVDGASARGRYAHSGYRHHRGIGPGGAIAGAALGIIGAAAGAAVASHSYNGYPAYDYGPAYGPRYGYDYYPNNGYYGPY